MRTFRILLTVLVLLAVTATVSEAQILDRPSRPFRGVFGGAEVPNPNRTRNELTLFADVLGGYDSNLAPEGSSPVQRATVPASGYTGLGDLVLRYWRGKAARNIEIAAWKLPNAHDEQGEPLLLSNEVVGDVRNLDFEREFGKMIAYQDVMAQIAAQRTNRIIRRAVQTVATAAFLPI